MIGWPVLGFSLRGPIAFAFDLLVGNRALDDQHERIELSFLRCVEISHELVTDFGSEDGIMQMDFRQAGNGAEQDVFDARLFGRRDRYGVAIAAETGGDPHDMNLDTA